MFDQAELDALREVAAADGVTVSEWVRSTLRAERHRRSADRTPAKLSALQRALRLDFPAPDIDQMLGEIARGRELPGLDQPGLDQPGLDQPRP